MTKFLIDTNSIVDAKDFFYAFDLCPGFWNALLRHHESGEVFSIDHVKSELTEGNDVLVRWAKKMPKSFFLPTATAEVANEYATIIQWVQANYQRQEAVSSFAAKADGWLIAYAKVHGFTIVSEEKLQSAYCVAIRSKLSTCDPIIYWSRDIVLVRHLQRTVELVRPRDGQFQSPPSVEAGRACVDRGSPHPRLCWPLRGCPSIRGPVTQTVNSS